MKIKVCGMRDAQNIRLLSELQPDYIGFIFYSKSKRYVGDIETDIFGQISSVVKKAGVFVNEFPEIVIEKAGTYNLQAIQLHGDEDPQVCKRLKDTGIEVIKAFGIDESFDFSIPELYADTVDYFLFDTKTSGYGGSGRIFNWEILKQYKLSTPYFISGGLNMENIGKLSDFADPRLYAADLNSGFEISPGMKNINKLKKAINLLRYE